MNVVQSVLHRMREDGKRWQTSRLRRLREMDVFILDNSIRETTIGQLRGHTLADKISILDEVKRCGLRNICLATFNEVTQVDDDFCQHLQDTGEDMTNFYSFSEASDSIKNGRYDTDSVPVGCRKNRRYGVQNIILEIELTDPLCDWGRSWTVKDHCLLLLKRFTWLRKETSGLCRILVNFRDFSPAMARAPERVLQVVQYLATMAPEERIFGIMYEDLGDGIPEELGRWTEAVRKVMDDCFWPGGRLLMHVHEQWGLQTAATLECLSRGADGVWCGVCQDGASIGHASSLVTIANLARLGNKKVLRDYDCAEMREAAANIARVVTGKDPCPAQVVYGERALDLVLGVPQRFARDFDAFGLFGLQPINRVSAMASAQMIRDQLVTVFGQDCQFTLDTAAAMKADIVEDLRAGRKREYMSDAGLAILFMRAGGKLSKQFSRVISGPDITNMWHRHLMTELKQRWDACERVEANAAPGRLPAKSFYEGFLARYFRRYGGPETQQALRALSMGVVGYVEWSGFQIFLRWALHQYPDLGSADEVLDTAVQGALIPALGRRKNKHPLLQSTKLHV